MVGIEDRLMEMELGPLFGLWFQSLFVGITMWALTIDVYKRQLQGRDRVRLFGAEKHLAAQLRAVHGGARPLRQDGGGHDGLSLIHI